MKRFLVAANWKMNMLPEEAGQFMKSLAADWSLDEDREVVIFPTALCWREVSEGRPDEKVSWGLQNAYHEDRGAYTGEVSMEMAVRLGARYALIGHSERRTVFAETDSVIAQKVVAAQQKNLIPMLCVGEQLKQRQAEQTNEVISQQLREGLARVDFSKPLSVAYEPVWAIGTGQVATPEQAEHAHQVLRQQLVELAGAEVADQTRLLYGGSVKPENASELGRQDNIDGFLVGGASLKPESFLKIMSA